MCFASDIAKEKSLRCFGLRSLDHHFSYESPNKFWSCTPFAYNSQRDFDDERETREPRVSGEEEDETSNEKKRSMDDVFVCVRFLVGFSRRVFAEFSKGKKR